MSKFGIKVMQVPLDMPEPQSEDVKPIAQEKVLFAFKKIKKPCVAQDSGFYIYSLNGFPKAFVKFAEATLGIDGILRLVKGRKRDCEFIQYIAYMDGRLSKSLFFESHVKGSLAKSERGTLKRFHWGILPLIFVPEGERKTLAQMSEREYYSWKERSSAESYEEEFAKFFLNR